MTYQDNTAMLSQVEKNKLDATCHSCYLASLDTGENICHLHPGFLLGGISRHCSRRGAKNELVLVDDDLQRKKGEVKLTMKTH